MSVIFYTKVGNWTFWRQEERISISLTFCRLLVFSHMIRRLALDAWTSDRQVFVTYQTSCSLHVTWYWNDFVETFQFSHRFLFRVRRRRIHTSMHCCHCLIFDWLDLALVLLAEHRSSTKDLYFLLSRASVSNCFHVFPGCFTSASIVLLRVVFGLPLFP